MNLIEYKTNQRRGDTFPAISIAMKGAIRFNRTAVREIGLEHGKRVAFFQDKDNPMDWYFKPGDEGVVMRNTHSNDGSLVFNFTEVSNAILKTVKRDKATMIRVATTPVEGGYYAILTRSI